jgi:hypothetical protein
MIQLKRLPILVLERPNQPQLVEETLRMEAASFTPRCSANASLTTSGLLSSPKKTNHDPKEASSQRVSREATLSEDHKGVKRKVMTEGAYEWFLELPVPVVLAVLWSTGAVLMGSCVLALYSFSLLLLAAVGV